MDLKDKLVSAYSTLIKQNGISEDLRSIREAAIKNFETKGFPTKKEEEWKYTSLRPVLKEDYELLPKTELSLKAEDIEEYLIEGLDSYKLVFVDGSFAEHLSDTTTDVFDAQPLSKALQDSNYEPVIQEHFNKIAPEKDSLSSLNTAFLKEGSFIYVKDRVAADKPVEILYFSTGSEKALMLQPRNLVILGENAEVKVIERHQSLGESPVLTNAVTEIAADKRAILDYYKIQNDQLTASLIDNTFMTQKDDTDCTIHTFSFGGKLTRNNVQAYQHGEHINSTLKGVTIIKGRQHVDHNTFVHHVQPNCESHQDYKGVYDEKSLGVFDGYILVDKIAQKTDGYQKSDNILLSDSATIHTKPQLEIYADDVKCSHGCTIGQMDEEAVFYLKTRGIPEKEARALLMYAFASTVLSSVNIPQLKQRIERQIGKKLGVKMEFDE